MNRGRQQLSLAVCDAPPPLHADRGPLAFFSSCVCSSSNCGLAYAAAEARALGSGGKSTLSHVPLPCGESRAARWRFAATGRQQCDLVSCFKGTFCGEWTVLCIRARCVLTRTTLRFVTLRRRRRQSQFIVYTYIHTYRRARLSCCSTKVDFREVCFVLFFLFLFLGYVR